MLPELALMGRELDRSKGAGEMHNKERHPGHYIDLTNDGKAMGISSAPVFDPCLPRGAGPTRSDRLTNVRLDAAGGAALWRETCHC